RKIRSSCTWGCASRSRSTRSSTGSWAGSFRRLARGQLQAARDLAKDEHADDAEDDDGGGVDAAFEPEFAAGDPVRAIGPDPHERSAADIEPADGEAIDVALDPVPGDVESAGSPDAALVQGKQAEEHADQEEV